MLQVKTSFLIINCFFKCPPNLSFLCSFSYGSFPIVPRTKQNKLESMAISCCFIRYSTIYKGYKCYNTIIGEIMVSCDVIFDNDTFPFLGPIIATLEGNQSDASRLQPLSPTITQPTLLPNAASCLYRRLCNISTYCNVQHRRHVDGLHDICYSIGLSNMQSVVDSNTTASSTTQGHSHTMTTSSSQSITPTEMLR